MKNKEFEETKTLIYLIYTGSDNAIKGTVVNRALPFLLRSGLKKTWI